MSTEQELSEMQREWRLYVKETLDEISKSVNEIKATCVRKDDLETLTTRVAVLEDERKKLIGALAALQAVGALVMWFLNFKQ